MSLITSVDLVEVANANITARTADAAYPKINVMDFWHLQRTFRANDVITSDSDYLIKFNFGAAQPVVAVFLDYINFDRTRIRGDAADLANNWAGAAFDTGEITVSLDSVVNRYKVYIPLTGFNHQYMAIQVPVAATAVGDYTTKWQIGCVCILETVVELAKNMSYGYRRGASTTAQDIQLKSGSTQRVGMSSFLRWKASVVFGIRSLAEEVELWTMNSLDFSKPTIFYENGGNSSKAYRCLRDDFIESSVLYDNVVQGNSLNFREI